MNLLAVIELLAALLGCSVDGPRTVRKGRRLIRRSREAGQAATSRFKAAALRKLTPHGVVVKRAELLQLLRSSDEFGNATVQEEYEPE